MAFTQDFRTQRRNYNDGETRIGEKDRLWYDSNTNTIRISDGETPGGIAVSGSGGGSDYVLPTASALVKGGVKIGSNITITDGVISVAAPFSGSYTDLTNKPTIPSLTGYATETFVTTRGYLTSVGTISYNDLTNKPTIPAAYTFNVAADDSTLRTISSEETVKFVGAGGITTASDAEGKITITGPSLTDYVTLTGEQTLTNKTLTSPTIDDPTFNGTFAFESNNTALPAMTLTASNLNDGVGILRVIGSEPDINFNQVSEVAGFNTFTFEWNGDAKLAMGRRNDHSFYITRNFEGWQDNTFVLDYTTGVLSVPAGVSTGQINFTDETTQTTAWTGSVDWADVNNQPTIPAAQIQSDWTQATTSALDYIKNKPTLFSGSYTDLTNKPTIPSLTGYATESFVTTRGYLTSVGIISYNDLTNKPTIPAAYTFNVAADDSTLRTISSEETVKFVGAGGITTSSDAEGAITITQGAAAAGTLTGTELKSTVVTSSLTSVGTLTGLTVGGSGGDLTMTGGAITGVGNITASGILAVNASGGITTTQTAFDIVNSTATTVNIGGAATAVNIGATTGTLTLNNPTVVGTQTTATLFNTAATTVSAFGAATTSTIGATSGTMTLRNPTVVGTQTTVNLWNTTSTTVNAFGAATTVSIGAITGTLTLNNPTIATSTTGTLTLFNTGATTVTAFGAATTINLGYTNSVAFSNTFNIATNAQEFGTKTVNIGTGSSVTGATYVNIGSTLGTSYVTVNGTLTATLTGNASTATKLATARAINGVNFDGSAAITVTADAGTLSGSTLASGVTASSLTSVGTLTGVTSNAATAFIAGAAAESGVALQMPHEGALRNLTNGLTNMYFDVSIGGSTNGQFQFRSSNSFTNVLTMSPTAFNVNTGATVTARTPSLARTAFNSAIDTELTVDEMRFRISNQGGVFPQVIGNTSTRNLAWTVVAARSGSAVTQAGSTGTLVASNAWTSLYTLGGMDSAGDTYTATLQDKGEGRIYRITFMRSDNGSTTGYNIIAERLL